MIDVRNNPVMGLDHSEFRKLLNIILDTEKSMGRDRTKTYIELRYWLDVLNGKISRQEFDSITKNSTFWLEKDLPTLISKNIVSPIVMACYVRMIDNIKK